MPEGLVRTDLNNTGTSYKNGTPITEPKTFGTPVTLPKNFGNPVTWTPSPAHFGNPVTWVPSPSHFGNIIGGGGGSTSGFELENGSGVILLENGSILLLEAQ